MQNLVQLAAHYLRMIIMHLPSSHGVYFQVVLRHLVSSDFQRLDERVIYFVTLEVIDFVQSGIDMVNIGKDSKETVSMT